MRTKEIATGRRRSPGAARCLATLVALCLAAGGPLGAQSTAAASEEGGVEAFADRPRYQGRQSRPIKLGVSGGSELDFLLDPPTIFCCSGTLGALVSKNDKLYVLSNNHVMALGNRGRKGDAISQPGMLDTECTAPEEDFVAHLAEYKKIKYGLAKMNKVDAALAEVIEGAVRDNGRIQGIGIPGNLPVAPELDMAVKKSGRSTGRTQGTITDVNATFVVDYVVECGSDEVRTANFKEVFVVEGGRRAFAGPGDSGSVIYESVASCPRAVGLLFAGNDVITIGSPMSSVLKALGKRRPKGTVELVGCDPTGAAATAGRFDRRGPGLRAAIAAQRRYERELLALPGVVGVGVGLPRDGREEVALRVYLAAPPDEALASRLPRRLDGLAVELVESGRVRAY